MLRATHAGISFRTVSLRQDVVERVAWLGILMDFKIWSHCKFK